MMKIGYKYLLDPSAEQQKQIDRTCGCCRYVWNWALAKINTVVPGGDKIDWAALSKDLTALKQQQTWLNEVSAQALVAELQHLHKAVQKFWQDRRAGRVRGLGSSGRRKRREGEEPIWPIDFRGWPRFKRRGDLESYSQQQNVAKTQNRLQPHSQNWALLTVSKLPDVRLRLHRPLPEGAILETVTISRLASGYYASLTLTIPEEFPPKPAIEPETTVGIDVGVHIYATLSNGEQIQAPTWLLKRLARLAVLQQRLQRKRDRNPNWKESKSYTEAQRRVALLHEEVVRQRRDWLHKLSHELTSRPDIQTIKIEGFNIRELTEENRLAGRITDNSWGTLRTMLKYKSDMRGRNFIQLERFAPTNRTCSVCGWVSPVPIQSSRWTCPCGQEHDKHHNSARVIAERPTEEI